MKKLVNVENHEKQSAKIEIFGLVEKNALEKCIKIVKTRSIASLQG